MGLTVEVGILADLRQVDAEGFAEYREQFEAINAALRAEGRPEHREPEDLGERGPWFCDMQGYGPLRQLRRLAAWVWAGRGLPAPGTVQTTGDTALIEMCCARELDEASPDQAAHLICHGDAEGVYLPVPFRDVIDPRADLGLTGGAIGSAYTLREECRHIAALLRLPLDEGVVWEGEARWAPPRRTADRGALWAAYAAESRACWLLHNACLVSITTGCAIVFS
jgi:hypothetical protein